MGGESIKENILLSFNDEEENIYKEALPHHHSRIDLFALNTIGEDNMVDWMYDLLESGKTKQNIIVPPYLVNKIRHLYFESKSKERIEGAKVLGIGYPMIMLTHDDHFYATPLFIWEVQLEPIDFEQKWIITHDEQHAVTPNHFLIHFFKESLGLDIQELTNRLIAEQKLNTKNLISVVERVCLKLDIETEKPQHKEQLIKPYPGIELIGDYTDDKGTMSWSGILGIYEPIVKFKVAEVATVDPGESKQTDYHPYGLTKSNPIKTTALRQAWENKLSVLDGHDKIGQRKWLVHFLTNTLSNGKKTLVVAQNMGFLQEIQAVLSVYIQNQFNFLIKDVNNDKTFLLEMLKAVAQRTVDNQVVDKSQYRVLLNKCQRLLQKLDTSYELTRQPALGTTSWTDTVGMYLASERSSGKELLTTQLNLADYTFNAVEYARLKKVIQQFETLYPAVRTLKHPLQQIHHHLYTGKTKEQAKRYLEKQLQYFSKRAEAVQQLFINRLNIYVEERTVNYEWHYATQLHHIETIQENLLEGVEKFGQDFKLKNRSGFSLWNLFRRQSEEAEEQQQAIYSTFQKLVKTHDLFPFFDFDFNPIKSKNLSHLEETVQVYHHALVEWQQQITQQVQSDISRLSAANIKGDDLKVEDVKHLEEELNQLLEELNRARIYQKAYQQDMLTVPMCQRYLDELIETLDASIFHLKDFDGFYDWQHNWLKLNTLEQRLVKALIKAKPSSWSDAFESWYSYQSLKYNYNPKLPTNKETLNQYYETYKHLEPLLSPYLMSYWKGKGSATLRRLKMNDSSIYLKFLGKDNHEKCQTAELKDIFEEAITLITDLLPVLFVTPAVAAEISNAGHFQYFDFIVVGDSQQLPAIQLPLYEQLGKRLVVMGNSSQTIAHDSGNLLDVVLGKQSPTTFFRRDEGLTNTLNLFYDAIFDNQEKQATTLPSQNLHLEAIDGRYNEKEGINDLEAQYVLQLLSRIKPTPQRTYPTVGIVCFTQNQRDLILRYLHGIKKQRKIGEKILQLERNGLGVYYLEELHGQHFDTLIISGTYGAINLKGSVGKSILNLSYSDSHKWMNRLLGAVKDEVYVLNSLPKLHRMRYIEAKDTKGLFLWCNFIEYVEAVENEDKAAQRMILHRVRATQELTAVTPPNNLFIHQVNRYLKYYLDEGRTQLQVKLGHYYLPYLIPAKASGQTALVLHPDGFFGTTKYTDFVWEYQQEAKLKKAGFEYYPIWSVEWWKNPTEAVRRVASYIIQRDKKFAEQEKAKKQAQKIEGEKKK